jgi:hypothetical protein
VYGNNRYTFIALMVVVVTLLTTTQLAHATNESAYLAGYKHGVSDGKASKLDLTTPARFNATQFNQGYVDGWCLFNSPYSGSDSDNGTFYCKDDATQYKNKTNDGLPMPKAVYTTNEGSYKWGYSGAIDEYTGCQTSPDDCAAPSGNGICAWQITNATACLDGYLNGWKHWCVSNAKTCADFTTYGMFPGKLKPASPTY